MKTLLFVTNHAMLGQGWADFLTSQADEPFRTVTGRVEDAVRLTASERPSFIVLDMHSLGGEEPHMIASLRSAARRAGMILVLSGYESPAYVRYLLNSGIIGLLGRQSSMGELLDCFTEGAKGKVYISRSISEIAMRPVRPSEEPAGIYILSKRELEIARYVARGLTSAQIAVSIGLATKTVEIHRYHILKKLKLNNRVGLINLLTAAAAPNGSINPGDRSNPQISPYSYPSLPYQPGNTVHS